MMKMGRIGEEEMDGRDGQTNPNPRPKLDGTEVIADGLVEGDRQSPSYSLASLA